ncbi:hypothetical protein I4U23_015111 [Adineta vaga]|nr:hypothetical protein I4U23_015111 [Adineta vaga]
MTFEQQIHNSSEQFQLLTKQLTDTEWSEMAISDAQSRLTTCLRQIRLTNMKINACHIAADKEHKRFIDLKKFGVRHAWYKVRGVYAQFVDKQAKAWLREFKKCQEEEQQLITLKEEAYAARKHLQQCQNSYEQYTQTKQELNELLDHLFATAEPSYPYEDVLKQDLKKKKENLINLQGDSRIFKHVFHILTKAHRTIMIAQQAIDDALNMETSDLFSHCMFGNMVVNTFLSKAKDALIQAQDLLNDAKRIHPNNSFLNNLDIRKDHSILNIIFDNLCIDKPIMKNLSESSNYMTFLNATLICTLKQLKEQMDTCEAERNQTNKDIKRLTTIHFVLRSAIVLDIIESSHLSP